MKILLLCVQSPWPPAGGTPMRSLAWLRAASAVARVGLVTLSTGRPEDHVSPLSDCCEIVRQVHVPRSSLHRIRDLLLAAIHRSPYIVQSAVSARMLRTVHEVLDLWQPDIVQAEWLGAAPYLEPARQRGLPTIYSAHNVEHRVARDFQGPRFLWPSPFSAAVLREAEQFQARRADLVVTVTEEEKIWFQRQGNRVRCIPNAIMPEDYDFLPPSRRCGGPVVFAGHLRYPPNIEAATELLRDIFPLVRSALPDAACLVAGRRPCRRLQRMAGKGVTLLADPKDMRTVWNRAAVLVCPLRAGAGSRLKLLEAAACGVPIVATPFSAAGLALEENRDFIASTRSRDLARNCATLLSEPGRWDTMARHARATVHRHHDWNRFHDLLYQLYEDLARDHGQKRGRTG